MNKQGALDDLLGVGSNGDEDKPTKSEAPAPAKTGTDLVTTGSQGAPGLPSVFLGLGSDAAIVGGLEGFTPAQLNMEPPRLRIVHKKDRRDQIGEPGELKLGTSLYEFLDCVFVRAHPGRAFLEGEGADARVYCASSDNQVPDPKVLNPKDTDCGRCEFGRWEKDTEGEWIAPHCQELVNLLGVIPGEEYRPFWFICSKTARKPALELVRAVQEKRAEGLIHISQHEVRITTEQKVNVGVSWYIPIFSITGMVNDDAVKEIAKAARGLRYLPRLAVQASVAEPAEQAEVVDDGEDLPF